MKNVVFCNSGGTYSKPYKNVAYSIGSELPRGAKSENSTNFLGIHPILGNFHKNHQKGGIIIKFADPAPAEP